MQKDKTIAIAITRQMASGGSYIGHSVARRLGFRYVDGEVLYRAAKVMGVKVNELSGLDGRIPGIVESIVRSFSFGTPETAYVPLSSRLIYDDDLLEVEAGVIREIAGSDNAVILGRGGFHLLKGHPGLVSVFVHAPLEFRVKRLMECQHITDAGRARAEIEESDRSKGKYIRRLTGTEWTDATNYHLCVDTAQVSFPDAVDMVVKVAGKDTPPAAALQD